MVRFFVPHMTWYCVLNWSCHDIHGHACVYFCAMVQCCCWSDWLARLIVLCGCNLYLNINLSHMHRVNSTSRFWCALNIIMAYGIGISIDDLCMI